MSWSRRDGGRGRRKFGRCGDWTAVVEEAEEELRQLGSRGHRSLEVGDDVERIVQRCKERLEAARALEESVRVDKLEASLP